MVMSALAKRERAAERFWVIVIEGGKWTGIPNSWRKKNGDLSFWFCTRISASFVFLCVIVCRRFEEWRRECFYNLKWFLRTTLEMMLVPSRNWLSLLEDVIFVYCQSFGFMVEIQGSSGAVDSCWFLRYGVWCASLVWRSNTRVLVRRNREPTWRSSQRLSILVRGCVVHTVLSVVSLVWRKIVWPKHLLLEIFHCSQLRPIARFRSII